MLTLTKLASVSIFKRTTEHLCSPTLAFSIGSVIYTIFIDYLQITKKQLNKMFTESCISLIYKPANLKMLANVSSKLF